MYFCSPLMLPCSKYQFPLLLLENMWGNYLQKGEILEKVGLHSDAHGAMENFGMYVSADIATSFTLLVGIFFPSATGMSHHSP